MFRRKPRLKTQLASQSQPQSACQPQPRRERPPTPKTSSPPHANCSGGFSVRTRIARATGNAGRYACDAVRALPSMNRNEVILQATDGHQATCVLAPGRLPSGRLVPTTVLPSRQLPKPVAVRFADGQWESTEGKRVEDSHSSSDKAFTALGDVLPVVGPCPVYETRAQARRRQAKTKSAEMGASTSPNEKDKSQSDSDGHAESAYVVVGIDLDILRRTANALGTGKLTLFIPVPVKSANTPATQTFVNKPIPVCPANSDPDGGGERGIGVVMPFTPTNGNAYYNKARDVVIASEKRAAIMGFLACYGHG